MDKNKEGSSKQLAWINLIIFVFETIFISGAISLAIIVLLIFDKLEAYNANMLLKLIPCSIYFFILNKKLSNAKKAPISIDQVPKGVSPYLTALAGSLGLIVGQAIGELFGYKLIDDIELHKMQDALILLPPVLSFCLAVITAFFSTMFAVNK